jgi:acyl-CoA thioesterase-1
MGVRLLLISWAISLGLSGLRAAEPRTVVFLGDSITAGYGLENPAAEAYPALIQAKISATGLPYRVVNAGVSGDTTAGGLRRLDWIFRQRVDVIVIALGGNDGLRGVNPGVTRDNLQAIIDHARQKQPAIRIVLAGMQMPANMSGEFMQNFRDIFPELAARNSVSLVPFLLEGVGAVPELNQADLIHPTARGQSVIAATVWKYLQPALQ